MLNNIALKSHVATFWVCILVLTAASTGHTQQADTSTIQMMPGQIDTLETTPEPDSLARSAASGYLRASSVLIPAGKLPDPYGKAEQDPDAVAWTNGFEIDRTEVTNANFAEFLSANPDYAQYFDERMYITAHDDGNYTVDPGKEDLPVTFVDWFGAYVYANWKGRSLPTEEEWILAALGQYNDQNLSTWYPWGDVLTDSVDANLLDINRIGSPEEVQSHPGTNTPAGIADMAGNVAEWTLSSFSAETESPDYMRQQAQITPPDTTESGDETNSTFQQRRFVIKGGSYLDPPDNTKLSRRATRFPEERYQYVGFRTIRRLGPQE